MKKLISCSAILAVSDASVRRVIRDLLATIQVGEVIVAADGKAAIFQLHQAGTVDLIIAQEDLPIASCLDIARFVRWDRRCLQPHLPILSVGWKWTPEKIRAAQQAGINEVISAPFSSHTLQSRILSALYSDRQFISTEDYRGPDRRKGRVHSFRGPCRRASDILAGRLGEAETLAARRRERALVTASPPHDDARATVVRRASQPGAIPAEAIRLLLEGGARTAHAAPVDARGRDGDGKLEAGPPDSFVAPFTSPVGPVAGNGGGHQREQSSRPLPSAPPAQPGAVHAAVRKDPDLPPAETVVPDGTGGAVSSPRTVSDGGGVPASPVGAGAATSQSQLWEMVAGASGSRTRGMDKEGEDNGERQGSGR